MFRPLSALVSRPLPAKGFKNVRRQKTNHGHSDAIARDAIGLVVVLRQSVSAGSPIRRAASRGNNNLERTLLPLATIID